MSIPELRGLPRLEKLRIVEALWEDLASEPELLPSPAWHADVLSNTAEAFEAGKVEILEWEDAKRELLRRRE